MDEKKLMSEIVSAANEWWGDRQRAILLSQLGSLQNNEMARSAKALGYPLSHFISEKLQDKVTLIKHSVNPIKVGVVPIGKIDTDDPIKVDEALAESKLGQYVKFYPIVWKAFKAEPETGYKRIITIEDGRVEANTIADNQSLPENAYIIDGKWFPKNAVSCSNNDIYDAIAGWAKEHHIDIADLAYQPRSKNDKISHKTRPVSVLDLMLNAMRESDLKRVVMPLDVVQLLSKTKR